MANDAISSWEVLDLTRGPDAKFSVVLHGFARAVQPYSLTLRRVMSYIYGAPILDVSRSHTTTQHSR